MDFFLVHLFLTLLWFYQLFFFLLYLNISPLGYNVVKHSVLFYFFFFSALHFSQGRHWQRKPAIRCRLKVLVSQISWASQVCLWEREKKIKTNAPTEVKMGVGLGFPLWLAEKQLNLALQQALNTSHLVQLTEWPDREVSEGSTVLSYRSALTSCLLPHDQTDPSSHLRHEKTVFINPFTKVVAVIEITSFFFLNTFISRISRRSGLSFIVCQPCGFLQKY